MTARRAAAHSRRVACCGAVLAAVAMVWNPATAPGSALGSLRKGETVEVTGQWNRDERTFIATRIERLPERRRLSARGPIDGLDRQAARFALFGREIQVDSSTVFVAAAGGGGGHFDDLLPGARVDVSADAEPAGGWKARKIVWNGIKASDKVKGTITDVGPLAGSAQTIGISGLGVRLTEETELKTDYLEAELMGTLFSDEGGATTPYMRLGRLRLAGYARLSTYRDAGYTLSRAEDDSLFGQPAVALQAAVDGGRSLQTLVEVRMGDDQGWNGDRFVSAESKFELLQAYAALRTRNERGAALMIGRQRLRDQREWLFDEYLDAARLYVYATRPLVLEASYISSVLAPRGEKFETWDDLLLRARFIPDTRNEANVYWLKRRDSSPRRREPVYLGLSCIGRPVQWLRGWLEATLLRGEDKHHPQDAYALDVGTTISTTGRVRPSLTLAYAMGSGDRKSRGDPYSQEFRQTGYEDNSGRFGGFSSFQYYGEVLDPELSNIEVLTAGAGIRFGYSASAEAVFHVYRQHRPDDGLRAALSLENAPDGSSRDLGREADFILGVPNLLRRVSLSYGFGLFVPGDALVASDATATRHRLSVRVAF